MKLFAIVLTMLMIAPAVSPAVPDPLDAWFRGYNHAYFADELPDVIITHDLHDDRFMAETVPLSGGRYQIRFNPKFGFHENPEAVSIIELRNLLHESCHVEIFVEGDIEFNDHGPKWESCMHRLADQRAFDNLW